MQVSLNDLQRFDISTSSLLSLSMVDGLTTQGWVKVLNAER